MNPTPVKLKYYTSVSARQLLFVWCSLSDDCQISHQTSFNSHQTSVRQVPDIHQTYTIYLTDIWWMSGIWRKRWSSKGLPCPFWSVLNVFGTRLLVKIHWVAGNELLSPISLDHNNTYCCMPSSVLINGHLDRQTRQHSRGKNFQGTNCTRITRVLQ